VRVEFGAEFGEHIQFVEVQLDTVVETLVGIRLRAQVVLVPEIRATLLVLVALRLYRLPSVLGAPIRIGPSAQTCIRIRIGSCGSG